MKRTISLAALTAMLGTGAWAQSDQQVELRMMWYSDGIEGEVMQDLLTRFEEQNPDIDVVLDNVAYQVIQEQLPIQLASGQGPDLRSEEHTSELQSRI